MTTFPLSSLRPKCRTLATVAPLVLFGLLVTTRTAAAAAPPDGPALLTRYCADCHNPTKAKGKLDLTKLRDNPAQPAAAAAWRHGLSRLRDREMPPEDAPQPTPAERDALSKWLQASLDRIAAAAPPSAGRVTARRLNRLEYRNTVRDLLGIAFDPLTFDPTRDFPADGAGYGFDNIGDVLSLSPLHLEQYLSAAGQVLDRAIVVDGLDGPTARRTEAKDLRVAGLGAFAGAAAAGDRATPRAWAADVDVRQAGEYLVRAEVRSLKSNGQKAQMAFLLDGRNPEKFTLTRDGKPSRVERKVKLLTKGPQQVAVAYLHEQGKENFEPTDGDAGGFDVTCLELVGPVGLTPETVPQTHKRVFIVRPGPNLSRREAARQVVAAFAARAFRRPVSAAEVERLLKPFDLAEGDTFEGAVCGSLLAVLVSPNFLFRVEPDRPAVTPGGDYAMNGYELASRLSYFIWSSMPDEELTNVAAAGTLTDPAEIERQVRRMIADPKSDMLGEAFATQWLQIRGVETLPQPDAKRYGKLGTALKDAMRAEPLMLFQAVLRNDRPATELLAPDYTFVNEDLAKHYGIVGIKGKEMRRVPLTDGRRGGVLTMAGVLAVTSHPDRTSPVKRGKWVLDAVLGASPPPPPPDVGVLPADSAEAQGKAPKRSLRQRLEQHRSAAACAACHRRMDPLGFALENYDAVGRWREKDGPLAIDAAATLPDGRTATGPIELKALLVAERDALARCLAEKLMTFAIGRGLEESDRPFVDEVARAAAADGYKLSRIVVEVARSRAFRFRQSAGGATTRPAG